MPANRTLRGLLIAERAEPHREREDEPVLPEARDEPHGGRRLRQEARKVRVRTARGVEEQPLHALHVGPVGNGGPELERDLRIGQVVVRDDRLQEPFVRDDDRVVGGGAKPGGAPADPDHPALVARVEPDVVTQPERAIGLEVDAGEEVAERVLEGEGHRQAAHAEGRDERRHPHAEVVEQDGEAHDEERDASHGEEERRRAATRLAAARGARDEPEDHL